MRLQAHEGFLVFRVNGSTFIGFYFRLILILAQAILGVLSGVGPSLTPGSAEAIAQAVLIAVVQLTMAWIFLRWVADADRVISTFAGTQFLLEGISTVALLIASLLVEQSRAKTLLPTAAFWLGFGAIIVPVVQLVEQRCLTPAILVVRNRGGDLIALLAAAYMLISSLPRTIRRLAQWSAGIEGGGGGDDDFDVGGGAELAGDGDGDDNIGGSGGSSGGSSSDKGGDETEGVGISGEDAYNMANKATKLLARGLAAKEATSKTLELPDGRSARRTTIPGDADDDADDDDGDGGGDET